MNDTIYQRPRDYELEHEGDDRDVGFYSELVARYRPRRLLELACGSGRLILPLAGVRGDPDMKLVGVELSNGMLELGRRKLADSEDEVRRRVTLTTGDMRTWSSSTPFDIVLIGCSSIAHLLTLEDRLSVWRNAHELLVPGGRLIVDVTMPDIRTYSSSLESPPRALVEIDLDQHDASGEERLVRSKTTTYDPFVQRASVRFVYDKFRRGRPIDRYISDFDSYVYFPGELRLLFMHTGFRVERVWGDYAFREPRAHTRDIVMMGVRPD